MTAHGIPVVVLRFAGILVVGVVLALLAFAPPHNMERVSAADIGQPTSPPAPVTADFQPPDVACSPGSLPAPPPLSSADLTVTQCVSVVDRRGASGTPATPVQLEGHFLAEAEQAGSQAPLGALTLDGDPPPEGIGDGGSYYLNGTLSATYSATFSSYVEVSPNYNPPELNGYADGYYLTATNRTHDSMEFLVRFRRSGVSDPDEWLQVYDWSCSQQAPCENGYDGISVPGGPNGFVKSWHLPDYPCWYRMRNEGQNQYNNYTAHYNNVIYYRNSSWIVDPGAPPSIPPLWRNAVTIFNWCTGQYDGIYSHDFLENQPDCSLTPCHSWAGIAERFPVTSQKPPSILKVGFWAQNLEHDGASHRLRVENSTFRDPSTYAPPYWQIYSYWENDEWQAGTYRDGDADGIPDPSDTDIDGDGIPNATETACGATDPYGREAEWDPYVVPERLNGNFAGFDDDADGQVDEALPSGTDAYDCDGDVLSGAQEKFVFSTTSSINNQYACAQTSTANDEADDRWPADFDDNRLVNAIDLSRFSPVFGSSAPGPPYSVRYDFNMDGHITILDVSLFGQSYGKTCASRISEWGA